MTDTQPMMQQPYMTTMQPQIVVAAPMVWPKEPIPATCQYCGKQGVTRVDFEMDTCSWIWVLVLCLFSGILCCWIPCVCSSCKKPCHHCSHCNATLNPGDR